MRRYVKKSLSYLLLLCMLVSMLFVFDAANPVRVTAATSSLTITSSSQYLVDAFNWAKPKALSYVQTGIGSNIPSYWAGYLSRPAFYSRDVCHMTAGAQLLGLNNENFSMLETFAKSSTSGRKYYPLWAFKFDGGIYTVDYKADDNFVREIPAVFEIVEKAYKMYLWSGDSRWINDPDMINYYDHALNDFISLHDENANGVAEEHHTSIWQGVATYNENGEGLVEAGDAIGSQYQAFLAYSGILAARGDSAGASIWATKAADLKNHFNTNWFSTSANRYIRGFSSSWTPKTDFGKENSWFMPMKQITNPGSRTDSYLTYIDSSVSALAPFNIEAYTYLPEAFYLWGRNDLGWKWLKYIADSRSTYPEISYTVIGHTAEGMMGIQPNAPQHKVATLPRLTPEVGWVQLDHIPVGGHDILVKHEGNTKTTLKHNTGTENLTWEAQFDGSYSTLYLDGTAMPASQKTVNGRTLSYITVALAAGQQKTVSVSSGGGSDGTYRIINRNSGKDLGVPGASTTNGTQLEQRTYNGGNNQKWQITSNGDGTYRLINLNSNKAAVVQSALTTDGAAIIQWPYSGTLNEKWQIVDIGSGYCKIMNANSGKALVVQNAVTTEGAKIIQWTYGGSATNDEWQIVAVP